MLMRKNLLACASRSQSAPSIDDSFRRPCMQMIYSTETNTIRTFMVKSVLFPKSHHTELQFKPSTFVYACMRRINSTETNIICTITVKSVLIQGPIKQNCRLNLVRFCMHVCEQSTPLKLTHTGKPPR